MVLAAGCVILTVWCVKSRASFVLLIACFVVCVADTVPPTGAAEDLFSAEFERVLPEMLRSASQSAGRFPPSIHSIKKLSPSVSASLSTSPTAHGFPTEMSLLDEEVSKT